MFTNVADESMSAADSASFIIAQMKAFNIEADDAYKIIDSVNSVSNSYAVSSGQLAQNLGNMSAAMATGNNTFEQSLGMLTAMTEITRNAAKGSRALITVQGRLNQVVDESSDTGKALTEWYQKHDIVIKDDEGQVRSLYEVLTDVAKIWPKLTKNEQMYYLQQQAGTTQTQNLAALLQNYQTAIKATNTALESNGSAMKENEAYMDSLEAKEQSLKAEFEDFSNRVLSKEFVGGFLDAGKVLLEFANNDVGAAITRITGFATVITSLVGIAGTVIGKLSQLSSTLSSVGGATGLLGTLVDPGTLLIIAGIATAIGLVVEGIKAWKEAVENSRYENLIEQYHQLNEEIQSTSDSIEKYEQKLNELNNIPDKDRSATWQQETDKINRQIEALQFLLDLQQKEADKKREQAYNAPRIVGVSTRQVGDAIYSRTDETGIGQMSDIVGSGMYAAYSGTSLFSKEQIEALNTEYDDLTSALYAVSGAFDDLWTTADKEDFAEAVKADDVQEQLDIMQDVLSKIGIYFTETKVSSEEWLQSQAALGGELYYTFKNAADAGEKVTKAQKDQADAYISTNKEQYEYLQTLSSLGYEQEAFTAEYERFAKAVVSYNISQGLMSSGDAVVYLVNNLLLSKDAAIELVNSLSSISGVSNVISNDFVELADGALALKENCYQATDGLYYLKDGCEALAGSGDGAADALSQIEVATYDTSTAAAQLTASLFDQNGQLTEAGLQALSVDSSMRSMAQAELQAQQEAASANYSKLILEIQKVGSAAMITAGQLQTMMALAGASSASDLVGGLASGGASTESSLKAAFYRTFGKSAESDVALYNKWVSSRISAVGESNYDKLMSETQKKLDELEKNFPSGGGGGGSSKKSAEEKAAEEAEKQAKKAQQAQEKAAKESQQAYESAAKSAEQAAQQAAQAAEQAAEEAKQKILDSIQELKDASDDFWDSKTDAIEETNKELDRQKQLEEKLKALEEAKQKKILLYKNGQFQYDKDYGTIAKAQADYEETRDKIQRERELEQLKEMKDNATEIFNEMKDIVQNGGNVTQEMINNWLKNMAASGSDYYDSNKKLLNEWLDWAKDAIKAFGQATVEAAGGTYTSTSSLMSSGSYGGSSATATDTNGAGYLNDPMYWDKDGNFVGFSTAWWIDRFDKQMKSGFKPEEWLGGGLGTNLFDDWEEVFKYWAENTTDPYALQDMSDRLKAAQIVMSHYKDIFKSLGYDEYYQLAEKAEAIDPTKISKMGWGAGAIAHTDDPFGWRSITASDIKGSATGELYSLLRDISDYEWIRSDADIVSDISAAFKAYRTSKQGAATGYSGEVEFDTTNLKAFFDDNNKRLEELGQLWFDASAEQRKLLEQEAEARRKAGELAAGQLGIEGASEIYEAQREANRQAGGTMEARQQQKKNAKNIESIEEILKAVEKGQDISDEYINSAKDYLAKAIKENREASDKLYSDTEKAKLDAQNEQMKDISDRLNNIQESGVSIKTTDLLEGETTPWEDQLDKEDIQDWLRDEDFDKDLEAKRAQMLANAEAWWNATTQEEKDALHKANETLAKEIGGLTYDSSSGIWSKHATGTHNARGGLSIVGERGPEMRILNKGDNIIPANQTANLWKWSNTTPQAVLSTLSSRNGAGNTSYAFDVSRIELPNVTDAKSFVQGLKNYALQYSYKR